MFKQFSIFRVFDTFMVGYLDLFPLVKEFYRHAGVTKDLYVNEIYKDKNKKYKQYQFTV